ncbi:MAG: response regulator [Desulfobulbaceae bacterium]|nr:response regulator [Desulfobulbaceae bacterium]
MEQKSVLLVDDERIILETLRTDLSHHDYDVDTVESGEEALRCMAKKPYNLLITDLIMEGMGGIELLEKARKMNPFMAVCLLTGYADLTSAIDALRLGADDYLIKPCDSEELILRAQRALKREELRKKVNYYENILPVCAVCKKIRDDSGMEPGKGNWIGLDEYLKKKTGIKIEVARCGKCSAKLDKAGEM